jgi:hypothetical protein
MNAKANAWLTLEARACIDLSEGWRSVSRQAAWQEIYHTCEAMRPD